MLTEHVHLHLRLEAAHDCGAGFFIGRIGKRGTGLQGSGQRTHQCRQSVQSVAIGAATCEGVQQVGVACGVGVSSNSESTILE